MRSDERANEEQIRRSQGRDKLLKQGAGLALSAGTAALGAGVASKIVPLLSEYIPMDLAMKGISKVSPKVGEFLKRGQSLGLDMKEGFNFIRENLAPKQETEEPAQEHPILQEAKIFEAEFPKIAQAIANLMKSGRTPIEAAEIIEKSLPKEIKSVEKKLGKKFKDFILNIFGNEPQQTQQPPTQKPQAQQPQQSQNEVDPQLLELVQGIRSSLQGLKGK